MSYVGVNDGETAGETVLYDLGNFLAIATTGKRVSFSGSVIFRVADAKIVERWAQLDNLSLPQQLDAIPRARTVGGSQPHLIISSRTPLRTSENASSTHFVNKGKNKKSLDFTSNSGSKVGGQERTTHPSSTSFGELW